jgi:hypothetical protein
MKQLLTLLRQHLCCDHSVTHKHREPVDIETTTAYRVHEQCAICRKQLSPGVVMGGFKYSTERVS